MSRIQDDPRRRCLKVAEWPERDRAMWLGSQQRGDPFEERGAAAHLRPATLEKYRKGWGRYLHFLALHDWLDPDAGPTERFHMDWIRAYRDELQHLGCAEWTVLGRLRELNRALALMAPELNRQWLCEIIGKHLARKPQVRDKRPLLRHPRDVLRLAMSRMDALDADDVKRGIRKAVQYRDWLMLSWLAALPERRGNIANTELDKQLVKQGTYWSIMRPAREMKTNRAYDASLPAPLVPYLERYLAVWRPILLRGKESNALWISSTGNAMTGDQAVYRRIAAITRKAFGRSLSPHLFRDMLATAIAAEDPIHVRIIAPLLGHTSLRTSEKHYNQARGLEAGRRADQTLLALREDARRALRQRRPRRQRGHPSDHDGRSTRQ